MGKRIFLSVVVVAMALVLSVSIAQAADLPKAEDVLEKYIDAVGGRAAFGKLKSRITKSTFSLPDMGMEGPRTSYIVLPDKSYSESEFSGFGTTKSGVKDGVAWSMNPNQGPTILEGRRKEMALRQMAFNPYLNWKETYSKVETVGEESVGEAACYKLVLTPSEGSPQTCYFDKESGLLLKTEAERRGQTTTATLSDYKEVDGIKIAHKTVRAGGQYTFETTINSVEHNVDIPDDRFEFPDEIKALIKE